jgi:aspartyl-tRNA(Asn)/glutamyl-tRNA(Gln) amidotransferase subunit B
MDPPVWVPMATVIIPAATAAAEPADEPPGDYSKLFGFFVGEAMKNTQGKGNPKLINDILKEQLK